MKVSEKLVKEIEQRILKGEWKPGEKLPPERSLAEEYRAGRPAVREALGRLTQLGLVKTSPQSGTYITDFRNEASLDLLYYLMENNYRFDSQVYSGLIEFRTTLEMGAMEKVVRQLPLPPRVITDLRQHLFVIKLSSNIEELTSHDWEFHKLLISLSDNLIYQLLFNAALPLYRFYCSRFYARLENREAVRRQLSEFLTALEQEDKDLALILYRELLEFGAGQAVSGQRADSLSAG